MHYWLTTRYAIYMYTREYGRKELFGLRRFETGYFRFVYLLWKRVGDTGNLSLDEHDSAGKSISAQELVWLDEGLSLLVYDLLMVNRAIWELRFAGHLIIDVAESRSLGLDPAEVMSAIPELMLEANDLVDITLEERGKLRKAYKEWRRKRSSETLPLVELLLEASDDEIRDEFLASCRRGFGPKGRKQLRR